MGPFYQYPSEEELGNYKTNSPKISTTTSNNAVTMESIEQMLHKKIQDKNSKSNIRNNNKSPFIAQRQDANVLPITYMRPAVGSG